MRVVGYARTSTNVQDRAETIKIQLSEIEKYAEKNKYESRIK